MAPGHRTVVTFSQFIEKYKCPWRRRKFAEGFNRRREEFICRATDVVCQAEDCGPWAMHKFVLGMHRNDWVFIDD